MRKTINHILSFVVVSFFVAGPLGAEEKSNADLQIVDKVYPNLASGVLTFAKLGELPDGVLMRADNVEIGMADVNNFIANQPKQFHLELRKNAFFALEQQASSKLLLQLAKNNLVNTAEKSGGKQDTDIIKDYMNRLTEKVTVSEDDIVRFYKENESIFCRTPFEKVKDRLRPYVLQEKKQRQATEHVRTMGQRISIVVSARWAKEQAVLAKDNPLNKARENGKPTLAIFSAASCCGPDRMLPVLKSLRKKYAETLNIIYLEARKEQILAARYNIQSIPTQIFYDKTGKEFFRHVGLFPQEEFEKKLLQIGLK